MEGNRNSLSSLINDETDTQIFQSKTKKKPWYKALSSVHSIDVDAIRNTIQCLLQAEPVSQGAQQLTSVHTAEYKVCLYEKDLTPWAVAQKENLICSGQKKNQVSLVLS